MKIARDLGVNAYRISISWSRILPGGLIFYINNLVSSYVIIGFDVISGGKIEAGVNGDGIHYYNNLIDELLANGLSYAFIFGKTC